MKRTILFVYIVLSTGLIFAQLKPKQGFAFGALPAISYDSDLGFQYGALANFYLYGNGAIFPRYYHSLYTELSTYTKGRVIARIRYDSEFLIPKVRTTLDVSYVTDPISDFYGFNGYLNVYGPLKVENPDRFFYRNSQYMFRVKADFQGNFGTSKFGWLAGYTYYHFQNDTVNSSLLGIPKTGKSLFELYQNYGLISPEEAHGGSVNYLKVGIKYDTRDQLACPMNGIFTEAAIQSAPKILNKEYPHTKLAIIHRQYFEIAKDLNFAYRLDYQMTIGNDKVPYYAQPLLITSYLVAATNQGLGGKSSIRGILRNRIIGDDVAFGNFEFRYKFLRFEWLKQMFYIGTNIFFDSGIILKPIIPNQSSLNLLNSSNPDSYINNYNYYEAWKFHSAAGIGLKIGWNENFIISAEFGKALDKQDGNSGFYIGTNYLF